MDRAPISNWILAEVSPEARSTVLQSTYLVELIPGAVLTRPGDRIDRVHFVEKGFFSVCTGDKEGGGEVQVGLIGREGMSGVSIALGCSDAPFKVVVQAAGVAYEMSSSAFIKVMHEAPELRRRALAFSQAFTRQVAETGRVNARKSVNARLARWLLMAHDRIDDDDVYITHETLSIMLGVRRPGVTVGLQILEGEHIIMSTRGRVRILDRDKLIVAAQGAYGTPLFTREPQERVVSGPLVAA